MKIFSMTWVNIISCQVKRTIFLSLLFSNSVGSLLFSRLFKFLDFCDVDSVDIYILIHCLSLRLSTHHHSEEKKNF